MDLEELREQADELARKELIGDQDELPEEDLDAEVEKIVVVIGLPTVGTDRYDKLVTFARKKLTALAPAGCAPPTDFRMPMEGDQTLGVAFLVTKSGRDAAKMVSAIHGVAFDKKHTLSALSRADFEYALEAPEEYEEPDEEELKRVDKPLALTSNMARVMSYDTHDWLHDDSSRDQFLVRYQEETEVWWTDGGANLALDYDGHRQRSGNKCWCKNKAVWSPRGSYLATFTTHGIALWGTKNWTQVARFPHEGVVEVEFSPDESHMVTWDGRLGREFPNSVIVWNVMTEMPVRRFTHEEVPGVAAWPAFKWSGNSKYLARITMAPTRDPLREESEEGEVARQGGDMVSVYEVPHMRLLDSKSVTLPGVTDFQWSPQGAVFGYWCPEQKSSNAPAHIALIQLPSRNELRRKNLYNVSRCSLHWQDMGDFFASCVTRRTKTGKTEFMNLELFRLRDKDVPVESFRMPGKEMARHFTWEPRGARFSIVHSENEDAPRLNVSFYTMGATKDGSACSLLYTETKKAANQVVWSPRGRHAVLAGLGQPFNGTLEFWDVTKRTSLAVTQCEFNPSLVTWDPAGRMVATVVSQNMLGPNSTRETLGNGYTLWSFHGAQLAKKQHEMFFIFQWRPRPRMLLSPKEEQHIYDNLDEYVKKFHEKDMRVARRKRAREQRLKREQRRRFLSLIERKRAQRAATRAQRTALRDGYESPDEGSYEEVVIEVEEPVQRVAERPLGAGGKLQ